MGAMSTKSVKQDKELASIIERAARRCAKIVDSELNLLGRDHEDLLQEFRIAGYALAAEYRQGELSLASFIFGRLQWKQVDIARRYEADCRKVFVIQEQEPDDVQTPLWREMQAHEEIRQDIAGQADVGILLRELDEEERTLADSLIETQCMARTVKDLGMKRARAEYLLKKIRAKLPSDAILEFLAAGTRNKSERTR